MKKLLAVAAIAGLASAASAQTWDSGTGLGMAFIDNTVQNYPFTPVGIAGAVSRVDIYMNPQHTWRGDVTITITAPNLSTQVFHSNQGGSADFISAFFQDGGLPVTTTGDLNSAVSGLFYAASGGSVGAITATAGVWTLSAGDSAGGDQGTIDRLVITTVPTPASLALLGLGGLFAGRRRRA